MKIKILAYFGEQIRHYDGNGKHLTKGNKWSVSGAENGAGRKLDERERSGKRRSRKTLERERNAERGVAERERSGERGF